VRLKPRRAAERVNSERKPFKQEARAALKKRVIAESSGRIEGLKTKKAVDFLAILDFGAGFDLASERDDQNGETISATVGCVLLPRFSAGTDGMRRFR